MNLNRDKSNNNNEWTWYYTTRLCNFQAVNNELLREIVRKNVACQFFIDQSISNSLMSSLCSEDRDECINKFRKLCPLTTYEDYRNYIDRMVNYGEKNLLLSEDVVYFSLSSGTTDKMKIFPLISRAIGNVPQSVKLGQLILRQSFPIDVFSTSNKRSFMLMTNKKSNTFKRSKDDIPIGPISQYMSADTLLSKKFPFVSQDNVLELETIEEINDFETSAFVQLVFALAHANLYSYSITFAPAFIHSVKMIETYYEEISDCIATNNFERSSLVKTNDLDLNVISTLNEKLNRLIVEYGGETYRKERVTHIKVECSRTNTPGMLCRLWPNLKYASTAIGSTFAPYKEKIQFYCGEQVKLVNLLIYGASEGFFGALASVHTDEYFLLPTNGFFEFIKEEDIMQEQPETLLISEIQPGHRYELVCTTESGLFRYRMGDVLKCTRFLCRSNDLVPLPNEPIDVPRMPLISIEYRLGTLLSIYGERTNEQHVMSALQQTIEQWRKHGIPVTLYEFTTYPELSLFPARYVIYLELLPDTGTVLNSQQLQTIKETVNDDVEKQLCNANENYKDSRSRAMLDALDCYLVRTETFKNFLNNFISKGTTSPLQIKPHRTLKHTNHIEFFNNNRL